MRGRNRCRTNKLSEKNYHTTAPGVAFWYRITANFPSFLRKLIMSQQHTTQASGQGMLERVFKLREHGTTARTEVIAGFTTFLTMVYIVFVNPQILGVAGMDTSAVFVTTCLIAAFGSILMGLFANLPVALAALLQRLAAVRGRLSLCADQAAAAKWWLSMPMASVSAEGPMPKALSTRRTSPLMPGCRHQGRACPLRRARMTSNPLIVA